MGLYRRRCGAVRRIRGVGVALSEPLLRLQIFRDRGFAVENGVLGLVSAVFVPFFFFAAIYAQVALGETATSAGLYILYFFIGFVVMAQIGGRILDKRGARPAVVAGCAISAVGFFLLAGKLTDLSIGAQVAYIILSGAGIGLMLGTSSTDAVNRAPSSSYSEVTGITQTVRSFGASLELAVLGATLVGENLTNIAAALTKDGVPGASRARWRRHSVRQRQARDRRPGSRRSSSTTCSWLSRTRRRRSSTSWPGSWPRHSLPRCCFLADAWRLRRPEAQRG